MNTKTLNEVVKALKLLAESMKEFVQAVDKIKT